MADWKEKEALFLQTFLELNPATKAETFNFQNSTPVSDVYPSHAHYCNCFEPLILDEALASILRSEPLRPKPPVFRDCPLDNIGPGEGLMWKLTFKVQNCKFRRDDVLVLSYKITTPNEWLCGIVRTNDAIINPNFPEARDWSQLEVLVFRRYPPEFFPRNCLSFSHDLWTFWRVTTLVPSRREYWAIFTLQESHLLNSVLDPRVDTILKQTPYLERDDALRFFEHDYPGRFNYSQTIAIMECHWRPNITLIQGPPGTGKTETITGIVLYAHYIYRTLVAKGSSRPPGFEFIPRIYICSPSNVAIDNVLDRLVQVPELATEVVRVGDARDARSFPYTLNGLLGPHPSPADKKELLNRRSITLSTLSSSDLEFMRYKVRPYDLLIVDESGQATELQTLIPFTKLQRSSGKCILVGDHRQLPATVLSRRSAELGFAQSLFERIQRLRPHSVLLLAEQYRMHPEIARFPSQYFYGGRLLNGKSVLQPPYTDRSYHLFHKMESGNVPPLLGPYMFFDVSGVAVRSRETKSIRNDSEVRVVIEVLRKLADIAGSQLTGADVAVISFYAEQVRELRERIPVEIPKLRDTEVNTVDGFQGRQKDVVLLSCVQSGTDGQLGFLRDERRLNVAITRARFTLILVGDATNLMQSTAEHWRQLLIDAQARGCYIRTEGRPFPTIVSDCLSQPQGFDDPCRQLTIVSPQPAPPSPPPQPAAPAQIAPPPPPNPDVDITLDVSRPSIEIQHALLPLTLALAQSLFRVRDSSPPNPALLALGQWAPPWATTTPAVPVLDAPPAFYHGPLGLQFVRIPFRERPFAPTLLLPWGPTMYDASADYSSCEEDDDSQYQMTPTAPSKHHFKSHPSALKPEPPQLQDIKVATADRLPSPRPNCPVAVPSSIQQMPAQRPHTSSYLPGQHNGINHAASQRLPPTSNPRISKPAPSPSPSPPPMPASVQLVNTTEFKEGTSLSPVPPPSNSDSEGPAPVATKQPSTQKRRRDRDEDIPPTNATTPVSEDAAPPIKKLAKQPSPSPPPFSKSLSSLKPPVLEAITTSSVAPSSPSSGNESLSSDTETTTTETETSGQSEDEAPVEGKTTQVSPEQPPAVQKPCVPSAIVPPPRSLNRPQPQPEPLPRQPAFPKPKSAYRRTQPLSVARSEEPDCETHTSPKAPADNQSAAPVLGRRRKGRVTGICEE